MPKVFPAKQSGKCSICGQEMLGKRIALYNKTKQYAHADCIWPKKSDTFSVQTIEGQLGSSSGHLNNTISIPSFDIDKKLESSFDSVAKKLGFKSYNEADPLILARYANLIAEVYHSHFSIFMNQKIYKGKLNLIEKVKE